MLIRLHWGRQTTECRRHRAADSLLNNSLITPPEMFLEIFSKEKSIYIAIELIAIKYEKVLFLDKMNVK